MPYSISNKEATDILDVSETDVALSEVTSVNAEMMEIHSVPVGETLMNRCTPKDGVYICETCDARFKFKKHLNEHIRNIHTPSELLYVCQYCNKRFNKKSNLKRHENLYCTANVPNVLTSDQPSLPESCSDA